MIIDPGTLADPATRIVRIAPPFRVLGVTAYPVTRVIEGGVTDRTTDRDAVIDRTTDATVVSDYQLALEYIGTPKSQPAYASSDEQVATVDSQGFVTHVADGPVTITVTISGVESAVPLTMATTGGQTVDVFVEYLEGSLGAAASAEIDTRIDGKDTSALPVFTVQDHTSGTYTRNPACWAADIDMTGVSPWNSTGAQRWAGIAVAPDTILFAGHAPIALGATVRFIAAGTVVDRTIVARQRHPGYTGFPAYKKDLYLARLNSPLPASIKPVKVWPAAWADYLPALGTGRTIPCVVFDQEEKALVTDVRHIDDDYVTLAVPTDPQRLALYETKIYGDSGNPVCAVLGGELVLLTVLTSGNAGSGTNISAEIATLNSMMTAIGSAYQLTEYDLSAYPDHFPFPPHYGDLAAYWTADHGALDANGDPATAGTPVAAWHSRRGNLVLEQSTAGARPMWTAAAIGTQPALAFDGTDDVLPGSSLPELSVSAAWTLAMVLRTGADISTSQLALAHNIAAADRVSLGIGNGNIRAGIFSGSWQTRSLPAAAQALYMATATWDGEALTLRVNGTGGASPGTSSIGSSSNAGIGVGRAVNEFGPFGGHIGAVLIYPRALTPTEVLTVEQWLAARYGITLNG